MGTDGTDPDYYPFRWKVADAAEDLVSLHRGKLLAAIALLLVLLTVGAVTMSGGDDDDAVVTAPSSDQTTTTPASSTTESNDTATTTAPSTVTSTTTTIAPTTSTTTTATSTPAVSPRAPENAAQLNSTEPGAVIELSPGSVRLVGGLPSDVLADENLTLAETVFVNVDVVDEQVVDPSFTEVERVRFRLSAADLFGYNSDALNAEYLPIIDQLAAMLVAADSWSVEVTGHTDDTGPSEGNQRLSERRAQSAANRLIVGGVDPAQITVRGLGEDSPLVPNDTDAGRLVNRRVEFDVAR